MINDIIRIKYADMAIPESMIFDGGDKSKKTPIVFSMFLIDKGRRKILVDAGCESGFTMENFVHPTEALAERGIAVEDVTDVVITHADHDHIECVKCFPHARIHIQRQEMERGAEYLAENPHVLPFDDKYLLADDVILRKIGGHTAGSSVVECYKSGTIYVLCGDECYTSYNLENRIPTATSYCPANSAAFIERYADNPEFTCLCCHSVD